MPYCLVFIGDEKRAAPTLSETALMQHEGRPLFNEVLRNITLMLSQNRIHGDLSAYNILYWQGNITLIDFPQVTNSESNPHAEMLLRRDIERVCQYFAQQGVRSHPDAIFRQLWGAS